MKQTLFFRLWSGGTARRVLCGLLATAALTLPTQAVRSVHVQVDGDPLNTRAYVERGVTYVPLRSLLNAFGGWELWWDSASGQAVAVSASARLTADPT